MWVTQNIPALRINTGHQFASLAYGQSYKWHTVIYLLSYHLHLRTFYTYSAWNHGMHSLVCVWADFRAIEVSSTFNTLGRLNFFFLFFFFLLVASHHHEAKYWKWETNLSGFPKCRETSGIFQNNSSGTLNLKGKSTTQKPKLFDFPLFCSSNIKHGMDGLITLYTPLYPRSFRLKENLSPSSPFLFKYLQGPLTTFSSGISLLMRTANK